MNFINTDIMLITFSLIWCPGEYCFLVKPKTWFRFELKIISWDVSKIVFIDFLSALIFKLRPRSLQSLQVCSAI